MNENGFLSTEVLILLFILTLMTAGAVQSVRLAENILIKAQSAAAGNGTSGKFLFRINEILKLLETDSSPETDSLDDPIWSYIRERSLEYKEFSLTDISSRLNPIYVNPLLLEQTELKSLLEYGVSAERIKTNIACTGISMNIQEDFYGILKKGAIEKYFTPYGYLNINVSSGYSLEKLFLELTGNPEEAHRFRLRIEGLLRTGHIISRAELQSAAEGYFRKITPMITTLPGMNVNFIPPYILEQILLYPYGGISFKDGTSIFSRLIEKRSREGITPEILLSCIPDKNFQRKIFQYIGTKTWFWKIKISDRNNSVEAVIACFPSWDGSIQKYNYRIYSFN